MKKSLSDGVISDDWRVYVNKGTELFRSGRHFEALEEFTIADELCENRNETVKCDIAASLYRDGSKESLDAAHSASCAAVSLNSKFPSAYNIRGVVRLALGMKNEAISDFSKAIQLSKSSSTCTIIRKNRVISLIDIHNFELSQKEIDLSVERRETATIPWDVFFLRGLVRHVLNCGEGDSDLQQAAALNPSFVWSYLLLAASARMSGKKEEVMCHLKDVLKCADRNSTAGVESVVLALKWLSLLLVEEEKWTEAAEMLGEAVSLVRSEKNMGKRNDVVRMFRDVLVGGKRWKEALEASTWVHGSWEDNAWRGVLRMRMGNSREAAVEFTNALNECNGVESDRIANLYRLRSVAYIRSGEYAKAVVDSTHVLGLESVSSRIIATAYNNRGVAYLAQGENERARKDFQKCGTSVAERNLTAIS